MKKLFFVLLVLASLGSQGQQYLTPVQVTVGNERHNNNKAVRAVAGTAYGGPEYNENRNVIRFQETLAPGEKVSFDVGNINNMYVIALASTSTQTNIYSEPVGNVQMKFGMAVGLSASARSYEGGYFITSTPISTGNVLQISYEGTRIIYKKSTNGGTSFSPVDTSDWTASGTYHIYFEAPPQLAGPNNLYKSGQVTNQAPTVGAGQDQMVSLPVSQATLVGSATDLDGSISSRLWEKVTGPPGGALQAPTQGTTLVTGLVAGTYVFRFTAQDDDGASAWDEMSLVVSGADPNGSTTLSFPRIPFSQPDFKWRGGKSEQWHDQYYVNIPTEASRQDLDAVYFRFAWKEIETGDGIFRWATLEDEIRRCIDKGQVFGFGIMTQSASSSWRTGVQMDSDQGVVMYYPFYLHRLMQAEPADLRDFIRHDGGEWVPSYNSPAFLARTRRLNDSIYAWLGRTSYKGHRFKDVINYVDIRHVGEWGEWHYNATAPDTTFWPAGRQPTVASYKAILDGYVDAYPDLKTVVNFSVYDGRQLPNTWIPEEFGHYALTKRNAWGLVGWRRDQWGFADNQATYVHSWTDQNVNTYGGIRFDTVIMDRHNFAPVIGEPPGNWNNGDNPYMKNLPHEVRLYSPMSFGNGNFWTDPMYRPDLLSQGSRDSIRLASKLAGPRLQIDSLVMSTRADQGGVITLKTWWRNAGVCPVYDVYLVHLMVKNSGGQAVITQESRFRPKLFRSSAVATMFQDQLQVPVDLPTGTYSLEMIILDSLGYRAPLAIANEGRQANGSYKLRGSFQVGEACLDCGAMRASRNSWRTGFWVAVALLLIIPLLAAGLKLKISRRK